MSYSCSRHNWSVWNYFTVYFWVGNFELDICMLRVSNRKSFIFNPKRELIMYVFLELVETKYCKTTTEIYVPSDTEPFNSTLMQCNVWSPISSLIFYYWIYFMIALYFIESCLCLHPTWIIQLRMLVSPESWVYWEYNRVYNVIIPIK